MFIFLCAIQKTYSVLKPYFLYFNSEAGCDEAGRGCLAGPVTCAAVMLPDFLPDDGITVLNLDFLVKNLDDSKKLSEKSREILRSIIEETCSSFAICYIFPKQIDEINILQASILGMQKATLKLSQKPKLLLVDGNQFNSGNYLPKIKQNMFLSLKYAEPQTADSTLYLKKHILYQTIIKGDSKFQSIAAASILAKCCRDDYMNKIDKEFPMYNWKQNKGYPTEEHRQAIAKFGLTKYHRKTFKGCI
jgi:ribonuclease HII